MNITSNIKKGEFTIFQTPNINKVSITVALPAFNATKIIWLALESLVNQKVDKNVFWELIICEEFGESKKIVSSYVEKLKKVNCAKLTYVFINPKTEGIINNTYLLLEKWVRMAKLALPSSNIYVLMACDIYAHPKRLMVHHDHFKNADCIVSTQPIGPFYNILNKKMFIYDGRLLDTINKTRHLNMAFKLQYIKNIKIINKRISIDTYILDEIKKMMKSKFDSNKNIYYDLSTNWKYGFDTDGYNNISKTRRQFYDTPQTTVDKILTTVQTNNNKTKRSNMVLKRIFQVYWCLPLYNAVKQKYRYNGLEAYIPKHVIGRLSKM